MELIQTENCLCVCCMEVHNIKTVQMLDNTIFKNISVDYNAEYYYCENADELYTDETMTKNNDLSMKDAYRKNVGLLTSTEIRDIRSKYGISQSDLCTLLGWGVKTITRYEGHQIQDKAHDSILRKLDSDPEWFLTLLSDSSLTLSVESNKKYRANALSVFTKYQDMYLRKSIQAKYSQYQDNDLYTGAVPLCLDKVVDVIRYFSNSDNVTNLYKTKLMYLIWYTDFLSYKTRGHALTGLVYQALPIGIAPIGHNYIINLSGINYHEIEIGDGIAYQFTPAPISEYPHLQDDDKNFLDIVINKLGHMNKDDIVNFMYKEDAYKNTTPLDIISFKYAHSLQL